MSANQTTRLRLDSDSLDFLYEPQTLEVLCKAADTFVKLEGGIVQIWAASRDWFLEEWGRDTFVALPGLLLATKRYDEARQVFSHFAAYEKNGLLPNSISGAGVAYNTADASLWFIAALQAYVEATGDWGFVQTILPTVRAIIHGYQGGTGYEREGQWFAIGMDAADGLIVSPAQATWMDADPSGTGTAAVTPRDGKCVEINAVWYAALRFAAMAEKRCGGESADEFLTLAETVKRTFTDTFWNEPEGCCFDVVGGDPHGAAIRPNQLIAISHGGDLLTPDKQRQVVAVIQHELLTPGGLRTLSPRDSQYRGEYDTTAPMSVKDYAYHQGTVWPWLIGSYCDALAIVGREQGISESDIESEIARSIAPLVQFCLESEYRSLPEVFSGDPPHAPGGTTSQAWSVGEVLRILKKIV